MKTLAPYWLSPADTSYRFPDVELALTEPDGLLAIGGDLSTPRLLSAYHQGIFPWYNEDQPILWWSPNPRAVLFPEELKISRSLRKTLRKNLFEFRFDTAFARVLHACAAPRAKQDGTWITREMAQAYEQMHRLGYAHSVEVWQGQELVGGLYGIALGQVFFGESMFSRVSDASKVALVALVERMQKHKFQLIDCQVASAHLSSLGARNIPRKEFSALLKVHCTPPFKACHWSTPMEPGPL